MNVPSVDLSEDEFLVRTSNRITHVSPGALSKPCGFFAEILEENGDLKAGDLPVNGEMSSIAGTPEARARKKLTAEEMDFVAKREHGIYTHEYYRANIEQLKLLEWFRKSQFSARGYLEGGFYRLLSHCNETKRILEESFPKPAEIYDHVPDGYGIKSVARKKFAELAKKIRDGKLSREEFDLLRKISDLPAGWEKSRAAGDLLEAGTEKELEGLREDVNSKLEEARDKRQQREEFRQVWKKVEEKGYYIRRYRGSKLRYLIICGEHRRSFLRGIAVIRCDRGIEKSTSGSEMDKSKRRVNLGCGEIQKPSKNTSSIHPEKVPKILPISAPFFFPNLRLSS
ncbi:hypothetical protein AKJ41_03765 [candidate division MSBL1 archaeon SCGC-AAA259O05]|uniref:Uncharacterized protein n=1 Tax=candidate division MSBL1 archaeon SCGC-AAA259O05 TaxID=1698271 RepID=A0A133V2Q3_9EURY|nr:hypothetical protein AKJ41_03765 [candidate division MSBL1 archaeon SCGC-AAA259O05]